MTIQSLQSLGATKLSLVFEQHFYLGSGEEWRGERRRGREGEEGKQGEEGGREGEEGVGVRRKSWLLWDSSL